MHPWLNAIRHHQYVAQSTVHQGSIWLCIIHVYGSISLNNLHYASIWLSITCASCIKIMVQSCAQWLNAHASIWLNTVCLVALNSPHHTLSTSSFYYTLICLLLTHDENCAYIPGCRFANLLMLSGNVYMHSCWPFQYNRYIGALKRVKPVPAKLSSYIC